MTREFDYHTGHLVGQSASCRSAVRTEWTAIGGLLLRVPVLGYRATALWVRLFIETAPLGPPRKQTPLGYGSITRQNSFIIVPAESLTNVSFGSIKTENLYEMENIKLRFPNVSVKYLRSKRSERKTFRIGSKKRAGFKWNSGDIHIRDKLRCILIG